MSKLLWIQPMCCVDRLNLQLNCFIRGNFQAATVASDTVQSPLIAAAPSSAQPARSATPPTGVIAPSQRGAPSAIA